MTEKEKEKEQKRKHMWRCGLIWLVASILLIDIYKLTMYNVSQWLSLSRIVLPKEIFLLVLSVVNNMIFAVAIFLIAMFLNYSSKESCGNKIEEFQSRKKLEDFLVILGQDTIPLKVNIHFEEKTPEFAEAFTYIIADLTVKWYVRANCKMLHIFAHQEQEIEGENGDKEDKELWKYDTADIEFLLTWFEPVFKLEEERAIEAEDERIDTSSDVCSCTVDEFSTDSTFTGESQA